VESNVEIEVLERQLNDLNREVRAGAMAQLVALAERGEVSLTAEREAANMHCHTFFSYNGYGYSPTGLAWLGRKLDLRAMGIVDFDVLDGVDEFLGACDAVGLRGSAGMETRVFVPEFAEREINSPGEPGISYYMGIGFTSGSVPGEVQPILESMRQRARARNRGTQPSATSPSPMRRWQHARLRTSPPSGQRNSTCLQRWWCRWPATRLACTI